jgi:hypothetical protein
MSHLPEHIDAVRILVVEIQSLRPILVATDQCTDTDTDTDADVDLAILLLPLMLSTAAATTTTTTAAAAAMIQKTMENALPSELAHGVPIIAEAKTGPNWGTMQLL